MTTVGVLASLGGIGSMRDAGQHQRLLNYDLTYYARNFDRVYYFSYLQEQIEDYTDAPALLERVTVVPRPRWIPRWIYAFILPLVRASSMQRCSVLRAYQLTGVIPAVVAKVLYRIPYVTTYGYNYAELERLNGRPLKAIAFEIMALIAVPFADGVLVTNPSILAGLRARFSRAKCVLVPNGVDMRQFSPSQKAEGDSRTLLFVGRLEHEKNVLGLVDAVSRIKARRQVKLVFAGGGDLRGELEAKCRERGVDAEFRGVLNHSNLPEEMRRADIFVLPSFNEGQPKALLEALASGLPCAISETAGGAEIVKEADCGMLLDPASPGKMAAALEEMLSDDARLRRWAGNARQHALQHFDIGRLMTEEASFVARCGGGSAVPNVGRR